MSFIRKTFDAADVLFNDIRVSFDGLFEVIGEIASGSGNGHKKRKRRVKRFYKYYNVDGVRLFQFKNLFNAFGNIKTLFDKNTLITSKLRNIFETSYKSKSNVKSFNESCFVVSALPAIKKIFGNYTVSSILKRELEKKTLIQSKVHCFLYSSNLVSANIKYEFENKNLIKGTRDLKTLLEALDLI